MRAVVTKIGCIHDFLLKIGWFLHVFEKQKLSTGYVVFSLLHF